jgi:hypothetical protein
VAGARSGKITLSSSVRFRWLNSKDRGDPIGIKAIARETKRRECRGLRTCLSRSRHRCCQLEFYPTERKSSFPRKREPRASGERWPWTPASAGVTKKRSDLIGSCFREPNSSVTDRAVHPVAHTPVIEVATAAAYSNRSLWDPSLTSRSTSARAWHRSAGGRARDGNPDTPTNLRTRHGRGSGTAKGRRLPKAPAQRPAARGGHGSEISPSLCDSRV